MKIMKKLSCILISILLIFTLHLPCLAVKSSEDVTEKSNYDMLYDTLIEKGFTEELIKGMPEETLSSLLELVGDDGVDFNDHEDGDYIIIRNSRYILSSVGYPNTFLEKTTDEVVMKLNELIYRRVIKRLKLKQYISH